MEGYIESKRYPESDETQRDDTKKNKRIEKKEVENDFEERRVETNGNVSKADIFRKFVISHRISALPS